MPIGWLYATYHLLREPGNSYWYKNPVNVNQQICVLFDSEDLGFHAGGHDFEQVSNGPRWVERCVKHTCGGTCLIWGCWCLLILYAFIWYYWGVTILLFELICSYFPCFEKWLWKEMVWWDVGITWFYWCYSFLLFLFIVVTRDTIDLITLVNMSCQRLKVGYGLGPQKETTVFHSHPFSAANSYTPWN